MSEEFVEHEGALFKRRPEGGYHRGVYCPTCRNSISSLVEMLYFYCPQCNWRADFTGQQLPDVMERLPDANGDS